MASLKKPRFERWKEIKNDIDTVQKHIESGKFKSAEARLGLYRLRQILAITAANLEKGGF